MENNDTRKGLDSRKPLVPAAGLPGGDVLPFPPTPSASIAGRTIQESVYRRRVEPRRLPKDAPNILIVLIDDSGPGLPSTFGGEVHTPTMDRIVNQGIAYNRFHTTAMCSPTRASILTGRNHHRVGNGQIAELANDWDGYSGHIPKSSALTAEVLRHYGYSTGAWGKWHNTPAEETTAAGPFDNWPTGLGFEYFYGFLAGEASQYEPHLVRNTTVVAPPKTPEQGYHLSEDLADDAIAWLRKHKAFEPDKPFYMYWASGAIHGPHHIMKEWADKYKGKFDDGWDRYRERVFERAKAKGWIPQDAQLTPRHETMAAWDSIPEDEKPFQRRLMEVAAGFTEHVDVQVGRIVDEIERLGYGENTLILYIWGDNGSSAEGQDGTISELLAQNGIPTTVGMHIKALDELGGLDALGSPLTDNMYHAGWAWAGSTPYKGTKLLASHFGGTRNPLAVRWPARIKPDRTPRAQFHHCNDIVPTIYEILGINPPKTVNGIPQDPIDGVSFAYTFDEAKAKGRLITQYFEIMGSRAIYHDGWMASAIGPRLPWMTGIPPGIREWTPDLDTWELYNLEEDWTQASDLAAQMPEKLAQMKEIFLIEAARNKALPIGGGLWVPVLHPEQRIVTPYKEWTFSGDITRMPEFCAPALGNKSNVVTIDADVPANANGVLYKLGSAAGGLTCFVEDGVLCYEYNLFIIMRTKIRAQEKLPPGRARIEVQTTYRVLRPAGPLDIVMKVNGKTLATTTTVNGQPVKQAGTLNGVDVAPNVVPISAPLLFTANDCLDIGTALGSPVSLDYHKKVPFTFNGRIDNVRVQYLTAGERAPLLEKGAAASAAQAG
jgi:arylsulfatase